MRLIQSSESPRRLRGPPGQPPSGPRCVTLSLIARASDKGRSETLTLEQGDYPAHAKLVSPLNRL